MRRGAAAADTAIGGGDVSTGRTSLASKAELGTAAANTCTQNQNEQESTLMPEVKLTNSHAAMHKTHQGQRER